MLVFKWYKRVNKRDKKKIYWCFIKRRYVSCRGSISFISCSYPLPRYSLHPPYVIFSSITNNIKPLLCITCLNIFFSTTRTLVSSILSIFLSQKGRSYAYARRPITQSLKRMGDILHHHHRTFSQHIFFSQTEWPNTISCTSFDSHQK